MNYVIFDVEATGTEELHDTPHCIVYRRLDLPDSPISFGPKDISRGVRALNELVEQGSILVGHNIIEYDLPMLARFGLKVPSNQVYDTLTVSRAAYPGNKLYGMDVAYLKEHPQDEKILTPKGLHRLAAWGARLGCPKDEYKGGFEEFNEEMLKYCIQDTKTNLILFEKLQTRIPDKAAQLECEVAQICRRMRLHGVGFDKKAALEFAEELTQRRDEIAKEMCDLFQPWAAPNGYVVPKKTMNRKYTAFENGKAVEKTRAEKGVGYYKCKTVEFNPASTDHIADRLIKCRGWVPKDFTDGGKPKVTSEILHDLPYPEAAALAEYQEIKKILGYIAEGKNAWLKLEENGRLHGKVLPTGTVSSRASHSNPNTGNVPTRSALGSRCRALFVPGHGKVIVGADASGLQLRVLAHYLARWDDGEFARECEESDIHEVMRQATGLFTRTRQKTWTYAKLFGGQPPRLGRTVIDDWREAAEQGLTCEPIPKQTSARALGVETLARLGEVFTAFPKLDAALKEAAAAGELQALDGRTIPISSEHIAIAMALQSGEAVIMKQAMVLAAPWLYELGAEFVLWVHDEFQVECDEDAADAVGVVLVDSMTKAGYELDLRVRIDGEYKIGNSWAETH